MPKGTRSIGKGDRKKEQSMVHKLMRAVIGGVILIQTGVVSAGVLSSASAQTMARAYGTARSTSLPVHGSVPNFSLIERSGRTVDRQALLGKVWVVDLIYTRCSETCPLQSAEMAKLQAELATEPDFRLVSITIDPKHDTPRVLSRYANRFRADRDRWLFLTGEPEAIYRFAQEGLYLPVLDPREKTRVSSGRLVHSSRFVLVDRAGQIRGYYDSTERESLFRLRQEIRALLLER